MIASNTAGERLWWYPFGASPTERRRLLQTRVPLVVILTAMVILERLDSALRGAHPAGVVPGGFGDIATPSALLDPAGRVTIAQGWQGLSELAGRLIATYFFVDLFLMVALAGWLLGLHRWRWQFIETEHQKRFRPDLFAWSVWAYLAGDLVETGLLAGFWTSLSEPMVKAIAVASAVKWICLGVAVLWLLMRYQLPADVPEPGITRGTAVLALRGQLLVVGVLIGILLLLNGDIGRQVDEVMVLASSRGVPVVLATLLAVATMVVLALGGMACLRAYLDEPGSGRTSASLAQETRNSVAGRSWMVLVLADVPLLTLLLAIVRAAATVWASGQTPYGSVGRLVVWGVVLALLWGAVHLRLLGWVGRETNWNDEPFVNRVRLWALVLGPVCWALSLLPWAADGWVPFYQLLGTPAVLMGFALIIGLLLTGLTLLSDSLRPFPPLPVFRVRRWPVFTVLLVVLLLASAIDSGGAYYRVRTTGAAPARGSVTEAFADWAEINAHGSEPVPLVFVAAAGGGIRAAYWTRLGMDCVLGLSCGNEADHTGEAFLASGVSGGSLGLVSTRSRQQAGSSDIDVVLGQDFIAPALAAFLLLDQPNAWLRLPIPGVNRADTLERAWERADPGLAQQFGESASFPKLILNSTSVEDGCRLEIAEVRFRETPGTGDQPGDPRACSGQVAKLARPPVTMSPAPAPMPSGSPTPVPTGPGSIPTRDAFDHLCDRSGTASGITLSTAALMSARFPYVSPAGGLLGCVGTPRTFALDGGAVDNSGGTAVLEAWRAIEGEVAEHNSTSSTCVVPRLLILDSAQVATELRADDRPLQLTAPLVAALGGFDRRSSTPLAQAADAIRRGAGQAATACGLDTRKEEAEAVIVIAPQEQPGPGLPLGWTLSEETRAQMRCQLDRAMLVGAGPLEGWNCAEDGEDNRQAVTRAQAWFR